MLNLIENKISINGVDCYDLTTFADLTNRSAQSIRLLVARGNRLEKQLQHFHIGRILFVLASELTRFKFTRTGRSKIVDRFRADGSHYTEHID